ncbi:non-ribosomal peptide synthetase [Leptothoe kymatousa]|uniref:Amino acid adenylation domain-containing protein n=1 Tax=Leptothoe kymatousa TAU-MAC 1615 TaxID=2364775 RepID=A0ABS5Y5I2_9CYAN|nr:non-ribosomal peptide synthetase [Leptothoe kymatousa]MBT9312778.1 amino acid adenylation domain-containing protein [Leptothoe kymatousa TAU-MAC 1615]
MMNNNIEQQIASLSPAKRAILERRLQEKAVQPKPQIEKIDRSGPLPLSFAQQRLWFIDQLEPGNPAYNRPTYFQLTGVLNVEALTQSLNEIVRRHEVLRSHFLTINGQPALKIQPVLLISLPVIDLSQLSGDEQSEQVQNIVCEEAQKLFDLDKDPLIRSQLLRLGEREHHLLITLHHIVFDGWSADVLKQEIATLYSAFSTGQTNPLPKLPIQYVDYAHCQRQQLHESELQAQLTYWKSKLSGELPVLALPTDKPRSTQPSTQGETCLLLLPRALTNKLKSLSQLKGVTLFMMLLAVLNVLLYRQTGQDDIIVGTPIAGRPCVETENLIGLFLNSLALRIDLSDEPTFEQLLSQVKKTTLDAYAHQDVPFERLVADLNIERHLARHPIFEVMLNFANLPETTKKMAGVRIHPMATGHSDSKFTMTLYVNEQDNQLHLKLVYQKALFTAKRMEDLLDQFQQLLEQIVIDPCRSIHAYSLVSQKATFSLPDPTAFLAESIYEPVPSVVFGWREQSPERFAICQGTHNWTYGELVEKADGIARYLLSQGVKSGDVIAISGIRSFGLIASVLGVLSAGGVLLLIDPLLPDQRRQAMLQTANVTRLLWVSSALNIWPETLVTDVISPETAEVSSASEIHINFQQPLPIIQPDDPAYIFFTSGTTGVPKGVLGCHKGLAHFLSWQRKNFEIGPTDRVAQLIALSFDAVLRDIFLPLTSGATLCLPAPDADLSAEQVLSWLLHQQITVLHTVPTLAKTWLINRSEGLQLPQLRWVFLAGEPLSSQLVKRWQEAFSAVGQLVNLYGPTETTMIKCYYPIPPEPIKGIQPGGIPLPETQALIFSRSDQLCGLGEIGEIVLRTPFRTLGYINAPDKQKQKFRPNPHRDDADDILYYTGDLGRYRLDGSIEILGRADRQVKIRGVRIELGEIEAKLLNQETIQEAIVTVHEENDTKHLIAYVVPQSEQQFIQVKELRQSLRRHLPEAMVPSTFMLLEALPLTPNGKLDRRALPVPAFNQRHLDNEYVAPSTPVEERLVQIWSELLKLKKVGIHDNFFELGGHSLLATRIIARVRNEYQIEMSVAVIFEAPTIAELTIQITLAMGSNEQGEIDHEDYDQMSALLDELDELSDDMVTQYLAD